MSQSNSLQYNSLLIEGRRECALYLGVRVQTVARFIKKGMPCHKIGRSLYFLKDEIYEWVKGHKPNKLTIIY